MVLVEATPAGDHHGHQHNLGTTVVGVGPSRVTDDHLKVVGDTGKHAARVAVEGFAVLEPPAASASERRDDVAALLAGFAHHLQERTAHHLGTP